MKTKRAILLVLALTMLLVIAILPACSDAQKAKAQQDLGEIFPESTPTPQPTPTPEVKIGYNFTDDDKASILGEWPAMNTGLTELGPVRVVYLNNNVIDGGGSSMFIFDEQRKMDEAQESWAQSLFGMPLDDPYYTGPFVNEKTAEGGELEVNFGIGEEESGLAVYLSFRQDMPINLVDRLHDEYWQGNGLIHEDLTEDRLGVCGVGFYPQDGNSITYANWNGEAGEPAAWIAWYVQECSDYDGFVHTPGEGYMPETVTFEYDEPKLGTIAVQVGSYDESGFLQISFGTRLEF